MTSAEALLDGTPYSAYLYSYPHKTAYRRLEPAVPLERAWSSEERDALFLYVHVPFCGVRCGFCNLFTDPRPKERAVQDYVDALEREARATAKAIGEAAYARVALGGGTPTYLDPASLERVLDLTEHVMGADLAAVPSGIEVSPDTATDDRLSLLRERGFDRVSIGVQSFLDEEARAVFRPQDGGQVRHALDRIRGHGFPILNVDLIYGIEGQTTASWIASLEEALRWAPEELYLYPLYVRPLTGLGLRGGEWDDQRIALYRAGRDLLLDRGYEQVSMRMFRRAHADEPPGPVYHCQEDGMVGLGCGARSYTSGLHYSSEYAVRTGGVREILADYAARSTGDFRAARWGFTLDSEEQRRRWLILSLLGGGVERAAWTRRFDGDLDEAFPELRELIERGLATDQHGILSLTSMGIERSDAIGPWLHSPAVRAAMEDWEIR